MPDWTQNAPALLLLPLLVRLLSPGAREPRQEPWHWLWDPLLLLLCGAWTAVACGWWFSRFHLLLPVTSSDFPEYCNSVAAWTRDQIQGEYSRNRSLLLGWLPGELARHWGVLDGLALASVTSVGAVGSGVYLWARALGGRLAGVSAALAVGAVGALAIIPRTLTFYPELAAFFTLSGAGVAVACRWPRAPGLLVGALLVGLVLLADLRGLVFGLAHGGILVLAAAWGAYKSGATWKMRLVWAIVYGLCVGTPLWGSWYMGRHAYLVETPPLEARMDVRQFFWERGYKDHYFVPPYGYPSRYVWGRTPVENIPRTLRWLAEQREIVPADWRSSQRAADQIDLHLSPWLGPGLASLGLALWGLRRSPLAAIGLAGTLVPFAVQLQAVTTMVDFHERFLSSGLVFLPVLLGAGWQVACSEQLSSPSRFFRRWARPWLRPVVALLVAGLTIFGVIPTWLGPTAAWRHPFAGDRQARQMLGEATAWQSAPGLDYCYDSLRNDRARDARAGTHVFW